MLIPLPRKVAVVIRSAKNKLAFLACVTQTGGAAICYTLYTLPRKIFQFSSGTAMECVAHKHQTGSITLHIQDSLEGILFDSVILLFINPQYVVGFIYLFLYGFYVYLFVGILLYLFILCMYVFIYSYINLCMYLSKLLVHHILPLPFHTLSIVTVVWKKSPWAIRPPFVAPITKDSYVC